MRTVTKIILTIVLFMIMAALIAVINDASGQGSSHSTGPFGIILTIMFLAAIIAIWKYKPEKIKNDQDTEKHEDIDNHQLDKR
jgi:hypothetical protein